MKLAGQTAIVTGASRGIGKQIAGAFARMGANVVVAARTIERRKSLPGTIFETVAEIEAAGAQALAVAADMANPDDLDALVARTMERFGRIDILVNNAAATSGKSWGASLAELTRDDWMKQYAVNLHAPFTLIRSIAPIMAVNGGGRVINITTGRHGMTEAPPTGVASTPLAYPSSKAALDQFCLSVSHQLRPLGVSVVNLNPGFVRTEMVDLMEARGVDASQSIAIDIPTRAVAYLATCEDAFRYTGQVLDAESMVKELNLPIV